MIPLTKELLRATYEYLWITPPFNKWNLPPSQVIEFKVTRNAKTQGDHALRKGVHTIRISCKKVASLGVLIDVMAHEMVHAKCDRDGVRSEHGKDFKRAARTVCRYHGFDEANF